MQKSELERLKNERGKLKKKSREKTQSPVETEWEEVSAQFSDGSGLQCAEVSSNECAICLGEYEDDVGEEGELLLSWVECTNPECKKWMHEQCYKRHMFVMFATQFFLLVWRAHPMYCLYITVHDSGIIPSICTNLFTECVPTMFLTLDSLCYTCQSKSGSVVTQVQQWSTMGICKLGEGRQQVRVVKITVVACIRNQQCKVGSVKVHEMIFTVQ